MRKIRAVKVLEKYRLELTFDDGVCGVVDLSHMVGKGVFAFWRNQEAFAQIHVGSAGELAWNGEVDLCPDALYLEVTGKQPDELFPFLRQQPSHA